MFKCARNRGENGPNFPVTARERCFAPRAAQRCQGIVGARIPLTGVQRRPSTSPSNGAPPPHRDAAAAGAADSRQAEPRFVRGEGAATAAAVAAVAPPLTASLPSQGSPPQGPRSNRSQPLRPPTRSSPRKKACADGLVLPFTRPPSNGIPNTFRGQPWGRVEVQQKQFPCIGSACMAAAKWHPPRTEALKFNPRDSSSATLGHWQRMCRACAENPAEIDWWAPGNGRQAASAVVATAAKPPAPSLSSQRAPQAPQAQPPFPTPQPP